MEVTKVKEAARLLDQYEKLGGFLAGSPTDPDTLTLTLRKGKMSKSLTIRHDKHFFDAVTFAENLRNETLTEMRKLGIEV